MSEAFFVIDSFAASTDFAFLSADSSKPAAEAFVIPFSSFVSCAVTFTMSRYKSPP